jgi:dTDP-4-dehydrorhamnose reductase
VRLLIVGGGGMLGHKVWRAFRSRFDTFVTLHGSAQEYPAGLFDADRVIEHLDACDPAAAARAIDASRPEVIVNCVGIVKQRPDAADPVAGITVNALFPHRLASAAAAAGARLIHVSTDCVFSGRRGMYIEDDAPDASDLYGRSKLLGEVGAPHLTLRTSLIGRELRGSAGLVEWFLAHRSANVAGYRRALFSGVTTSEMARILAEVIERHGGLAGVYHLAAEAINKYDLLQLLNGAFRAGATIQPTDEPAIDRSLDGSRFRRATGIIARHWPDMIADLAADDSVYENWRRPA